MKATDIQSSISEYRLNQDGRGKVFEAHRCWFAVAAHFRFPLVVGTCILSIILCATLPQEPIPVPGRLDVYAVITNTIPVLSALAIVSSVANTGVQEAVSARGRLGVTTLALSVHGSLIVLTSTAAWAIGVPTFGRNSLFLMSVGIGLSIWVGARAAGLVMVAIVTVNWLLGIDTFNEAKWWAWLMSPPERLSAWMGALVTALIATAAVLVGPRHYNSFRDD